MPIPLHDSVATAIQLRATRVFMADLRDGNTAGLSRFFSKPEDFTALRPRLDSLAHALAGRSHRPAQVGARAYGRNNRISSRLLDDQNRPIVHIEFDYSPIDRIGKIISMTVMPDRILRMSLEPVDEPPPTQQMLEEYKKP